MVIRKLAEELRVVGMDRLEGDAESIPEVSHPFYMIYSERKRLRRRTKIPEPTLLTFGKFTSGNVNTPALVLLARVSCASEAVEQNQSIIVGQV